MSQENIPQNEMPDASLEEGQFDEAFLEEVEDFFFLEMKNAPDEYKNLMRKSKNMLSRLAEPGVGENIQPVLTTESLALVGGRAASKFRDHDFEADEDSKKAEEIAEQLLIDGVEKVFGEQKMKISLAELSLESSLKKLSGEGDRFGDLAASIEIMMQHIKESGGIYQLITNTEKTKELHNMVQSNIIMIGSTLRSNVDYMNSEEATDEEKDEIKKALYAPLQVQVRLIKLERKLGELG